MNTLFKIYGQKNELIELFVISSVFDPWNLHAEDFMLQIFLLEVNLLFVTFYPSDLEKVEVDHGHYLT